MCAIKCSIAILFVNQKKKNSTLSNHSVTISMVNSNFFTLKYGINLESCAMIGLVDVVGGKNQLKRLYFSHYGQQCEKI